jgi:DNA-binding NarL/FixJ family response regulator
MEEDTIIIADKDHAYRNTLASFFRRFGYRVEATGSADQLLQSVTDSPGAVLLLGSNFTAGRAMGELVQLLKRCNSKMEVILVSDDMSINQERQIRAAGIFFHALKPAVLSDVSELGQVVRCALEKNRPIRGRLFPAQAHQVVAPARPQLMHALPWVVGLVALVLGTNYISLSPSTANQTSHSMTVWLFLGFCALIVVGQLLPIFRIKLAPGRLAQRQAAPEEAPRGGK